MTSSNRKIYSKKILDYITDFDQKYKSHYNKINDIIDDIQDSSESDSINRNNCLSFIKNYNIALKEYLLLTGRTIDFSAKYPMLYAYLQEDNKPKIQDYLLGVESSTSINDLQAFWEDFTKASENNDRSDSEFLKGSDGDNAFNFKNNKLKSSNSVLDITFPDDDKAELVEPTEEILINLYGLNDFIDADETLPKLNYNNLLKRLKDGTDISNAFASFGNKRLTIVKKYLFDHTEFENNRKSRLKIKDGTLISLYKNFTSVDASFFEIKRNISAASTVFSKIAVWEVEDRNNNYLIIKKDISDYYKQTIDYLPELSVGDTVYVIDDNNAETKTYIKNLSNIEIDGDANLEDGTENIVTKVAGYSVEFAHQINKSYSTDANLRIVKEIS